MTPANLKISNKPSFEDKKNYPPAVALESAIFLTATLPTELQRPCCWRLSKNYYLNGNYRKLVHNILPLDGAETLLLKAAK